jgi:hypothetical protein
VIQEYLTMFPLCSISTRSLRPMAGAESCAQGGNRLLALSQPDRFAGIARRALEQGDCRSNAAPEQTVFDA